jgi:transposase
VLDQVFLAYRGVFRDLYSTISKVTLLNYPTSKDVLETDEDILDRSIHEYCPRHSLEWATSKADKLIEVALRDPFQETHIKVIY